MLWQSNALLFFVLHFYICVLYFYVQVLHVNAQDFCFLANSPFYVQVLEEMPRYFGLQHAFSLNKHLFVPLHVLSIVFSFFLCSV